MGEGGKFLFLHQPPLVVHGLVRLVVRSRRFDPYVFRSTRSQTGKRGFGRGFGVRTNKIKISKIPLLV